MLYDITPSVSERLAVWPGDAPLSREVLLDLERGDSVTLSTLRTTVHVGCHVDAPSHYGLGAPGIDQRPLDFYLGPCQVMRVEVRQGGVVGPELLRTSITAPRVLFATGTYPNPEHFNRDFACLSVELVERLHKQGVILIGIDTPSVDRFDSKDLPVHGVFLKHDMAILEGVMLQGVPEGNYELIALPLKLAGFDASPVRAVLRTPLHYPRQDSNLRPAV